MTARHSISRRRGWILVALGAATLVDLVLVAVGLANQVDWQQAYLTWNLVLAWVPLALALVVYDGFRRYGPRLALVPAAVGWLLFFPNAPYIVTDFVHLDPNGPGSFWLDFTMIGCCAATGLMLGFVSLVLIHAVAQRLVGTAAAWTFAAAALVLGSIGIYLGRFLRLNSWDAFTEPAALLHLARLALADPLAYRTQATVVLLCVALLAPAYLAFYVVARPAVELRRR